MINIINLEKKFKCPQCANILKNEGNMTDKAKGEYRAYESVETKKFTGGSFLLIECLKCYFVAKYEIWKEFIVD